MREARACEGVLERGTESRRREGGSEAARIARKEVDGARVEVGRRLIAGSWLTFGSLGGNEPATTCRAGGCVWR